MFEKQMKLFKQQVLLRRIEELAKSIKFTEFKLTHKQGNNFLLINDLVMYERELNNINLFDLKNYE